MEKTILDKIFDFITYLAYKLVDSKYIQKIGVQDINPYFLLLIVSLIVWFILDIFFQAYKKWSFYRKRKIAIKENEWKKDIEKRDEILALKKRQKEQEELEKILGKTTSSSGLSLDDLGALLIKQNKELEEIKKQKQKEKVVVKEVVKEVKPKEEKPKTEIKLKPKVKEINVTIPKIKLLKEEEGEIIEPIVASVLGKDITTTDNDRVEISSDYQDEIEEKVEEQKQEELEKEEVEEVDNFEETKPIEIEETKEEPVVEAAKEEEENPLEALRRKNEERKKHREQIQKEIEERA